MKCWKGKDNTPKAGQFGTMDDTSCVPDSIEIMKTEYDVYVAAQPIIEHIEEIIEYEDMNTGKKYRMKRL